MTNNSGDKIIKRLAQMGEVTLVKPDGTRITLNNQGKIPLQSQLDAVIYFFQRMDLDMLSLILEEHVDYCGLEKPVFMNKLADLFTVFQERGNSFLNTYRGTCACSTCIRPCIEGLSFIGNKTNDYLDLTFQKDDHQIAGISICYQLEHDEYALIKNEHLDLYIIAPF